MFINLLKGFIIGIANIIPGVSGGTFALILGIYPKLMESLSNINKSYIVTLFGLLKKRDFSSLLSLLKEKGTIFLGYIGFGAILSILTLSKLLKYALETHYEVTYGLFFGLILVSIVIPIKLMDKKSVKYLPFLLLGMGLTVYIAMAVDPSVKVLQKSQHLMEILKSSVLHKVGINTINFTDYISIFFIGMLAISAMILPGISGSFILLLFGAYYPIISAISRISKFNLEDIVLLSSFSFGMIFGILIFVRIFDYIYKKFKDATLSFLTGLMIGSLYALWPFKVYIFKNIYVKVLGNISLTPNAKIYTNKLCLPHSAGELFPVLVAVVVGSLIMLFFVKYENKNS